MGKLVFTDEHLDKVTSAWASSLVGKCMKRFEIIDDKDEIKSAVRELIYENIRDLKINIKSFNWGVKFRTSGNKR